MSELPHLASPTLGDQAYAAVREAIVSGSLERGAKVTERGLAESLNISPTPVREALRRLEQDRLVVRTGPRSVRIADFGERDLNEITMIEDSLRALAARLAAVKASSDEIEAMRESLERAEKLAGDGSGRRSAKALDEISDELRSFHNAIDLASGSPTLIHMLNMVQAFNAEERRRLLASQLGNDPESVRQRFEQHRQIFSAIVARDPVEAERLMGLHSRSGNEHRLAARSDGAQ